MIKDVVISDPERLEKLKEEILKGGSAKLHILSDFDRTLTNAFVKEEKVPSLISILRSKEEYLGKDYAEKAQSLYRKYHPIEIDPEISIEKKKEIMGKWWETHFELLIKSGLGEKHIEEVAESTKIKFRKGALDFFDFLNDNKIPLIIMSSSGLGGDVISMALKRIGKLYPNTYIISNSFIWDKKGNAIGVKKPIIHVFNKDETILKNFSFYPEVETRKNVLLLGDSLGDIGMIKGFDYNSLIKIGFLNENIKESLEEYKKNYDVLILNDSSMDYINFLLKQII